MRSRRIAFRRRAAHRMTSSMVEIQEPRAQSVRVTEDALSVDLVDGRTIIVPLVWYPRLWHGTPDERNAFEICGFYCPPGSEGNRKRRPLSLGEASSFGWLLRLIIRGRPRQGWPSTCSPACSAYAQPRKIPTDATWFPGCGTDPPTPRMRLRLMRRQSEEVAMRRYETTVATRGDAHAHRSSGGPHSQEAKSRVAQPRLSRCAGGGGERLPRQRPSE